MPIVARLVGIDDRRLQQFASVTPPGDLVIAGSETGEARARTLPALAAFLLAGSARDLVDASPERLPVQVDGTDVTGDIVFPCGRTLVTFGFRDRSGNVGTANATVTVLIPTATAVSVVSVSQQYSDTVTLTATLSPATLVGSSDQRYFHDWFASGLRLREPVPFGTSPTGEMAPGPQTVTAVFGGVNSNFIVTNPTTTLTIAKENAVATYTGAVFASTACVTCNTATVTLSATVRDISAVPTDPATDGQQGDIRHATVRFEIVETGQTFPGVPVGLVNSADTRVGAATKNVSVSIGNADALALTVRVFVDGYCTSPVSHVEQAVLTVAKPLASSFISGGAYLQTDFSITTGE